MYKEASPLPIFELRGLGQCSSVSLYKEFILRAPVLGQLILYVRTMHDGTNNNAASLVISYTNSTTNPNNIGPSVSSTYFGAVTHFPVYVDLQHV